MMTNKQPWQTIVNPMFLSKIPEAETRLSVVKRMTSEVKKATVNVVKLTTEKRYSFDDNGGSYQGL